MNGMEEEVKRWEEEVRRKSVPILRYRDELEKLYDLYKCLPTAYQCPFCGYVSTSLNMKKIEVWVRYYIAFGDDTMISKELIDFCDCPKCKTTPEKCGYIRNGYIDYADLKEVRPKKIKVMTKEYKQLLNDLRMKMGIRVYQDDYGKPICQGNGFKIYEAVDEIVCETEAGLDCCLEDLPEDVGKLVWTIYYLVAGQVPAEMS